MKKYAIATSMLILFFAIISAASAADIAVGTVMPYTGQLGELGGLIRDGAILAARQVTASGFEMELLHEDSKTLPTLAAAAAKKLVDEDRVVAIVGALSSGATLAVADSVTIPNEVILISPASTSPLLTAFSADEGKDFLFRTCPSDAVQGIAAAWLAAGYNKRVAVIYVDNAYGQGLSEVFKESFERMGGEITAIVGHDQKVSESYAAELQHVLASNPDCLAIFSYPLHAAVYLRQAVESFKYNRFLFSGATKSEYIVETLGSEQLEGQKGTAPGMKDGEALKRFNMYYEHEYGRLPNTPYISYAYDATAVIGLAAYAAKAKGLPLTSKNIRDNLRAVANPPGEFIYPGDFGKAFALLEQGKDINYEGAAGSVDFDKYGDALSPIEIWEYRNGEPKTLRTVYADSQGMLKILPEHQIFSISGHPKTATAYWNSWFQKKINVEPKMVESLEVSDIFTYEFILDLAPFNYNELEYDETASVIGDPELVRKMNELINAGLESFKFKIRPLKIGDQIEIVDSNKTFYEFDVNLQRLLETKPRKTLFAGYLADALSLESFASKVHAGELRIEVQARNSGCAAIALSVWDQTGSFPYDHLIRAISVYNKGEPVPYCGETSNALRGGFKTLLETAIDHQLTSGPASADAAIHIFETKIKSSKESVAVFVDNKNMKPSSENMLAEDRGIYSWKMRSALSDYIRDPHQLLTVLRRARDLAKSGHKNTYLPVAQELQKKIFSSDDSNGTQNAQEAFRCLQTLAKKSEPPAVLMARLVSEHNELLYLPLGLLAASAGPCGEPILENQMIVVQPLTIQRYVRESTCIDPWVYGIPKILMGATDWGTENLKSSCASSWISWVDNLQDLTKYLRGKESSMQFLRSEGLLLLAHHNNGNFWFESPDQRTTLEDILREFRPGSVAILTTCSTAGSENGNQIILNEFNKRGVDAMIVSPFEVPVDYGAQLAIEFAKIIRDARLESKQETIASLFKRSIDNTSSFFLEKKGKHLDQLALEFIIVGDHGLTLCEP